MGLVVIIIVILTLIFSLWYFYQKQILYTKIAIILLALTARIFISTDPELHDWDEQYHALVGKNFFRGDFKAELYEDQLIDYDFKEWIANGVWYSKGPVPLVLIGISVQLFGEHPFAVRLPSIILGLLSVWLTFLIAKRLFNERLALIAMLLHALHGSLIELIGGRLSSDHVELAFVFFVQLSFFLLIKWTQQKDKRPGTLILMGITVGFAFLSKWFPAFLVYPVFGVLLLIRKGFSWRDRFQFLLIGLLGSGLIIIPYVLVQWSAHPVEFSWMMKQLLFGADTQASFHASPWYYYFENIHAIFGPIALIAVILMFYQIKSIGREKALILLLWMLIPFLIFSIPQMKRQTYMLIAAPAYFVMIANLIYQLIELDGKSRGILITARAMALLVLGFSLAYHFNRLKYLQDPAKSDFNKSEWLAFEASLNEPSKTVVFNFFECHKTMFYTDIIVYRNPCPESSHPLFQTHHVYTYEDGKFLQVKIN